MSARLIAACRAYGLKDSDDTVFELMAGCVGEGPALEYKKWHEGDELPDLEEIIRDPDKLVLPKRGDRAYAVLSGIAALVVANNTEDRWKSAWVVMSKAAEMKVPDIAAACARILVKNRWKANALPPKDALRFKSVLEGAGLW
jgi:hypothetical protein